MTDKMDVLFIKSSKHILAAVTRSANPTGKIKAEDVAGAGLLVRGFAVSAPTTGNERFEVPPQDLDVASVDFDPAIIVRPRAYSVEDGEAILTPTASTVSAVNLTATNVVVTVSAAVTEETKVRVQVEGGNLEEPRIVEGKIPNTATGATLPIMTLDPGTYFVLSLVADRPPHARTQTI